MGGSHRRDGIHKTSFSCHSLPRGIPPRLLPSYTPIRMELFVNIGSIFLYIGWYVPSWCMSISGTNYEYLYLLDFTLFYRHYTYNLIDPISRERTVTDGVHVFAALDLVYSYTIHAKNPNVLKHKIFNYSIRFKGTHSDAETADYLGITRMRVAKLARK